VYVMLRNDFHNTSIRIRVPSLPYTLSGHQSRRLRRALCGASGLGCKCGVVRGAAHSEAGKRLSVYPDADDLGRASWTIAE